MLLRQLKLQNIRSYSNETINFPEGSILLSGDIGSGKSTILLAIEFALFGTSRTDLPGEALLRKGATQGSVELSFRLAEKEIIIKRGLKKEREKDKETINQTAGYIIFNITGDGSGNAAAFKKELTPVELKAEIINLLGYPEEFITKNKNYIFRYTVYTPQEEIKSILEENSETRLDTLRKIFNIDKYKTIRENLQNYLKQLRSHLAVLEEKIAPLEEKKLQIAQLGEEKKKVQLALEELKPKIEQLSQQLEDEQKGEQYLELQQKIYLELKQNCQTLLLLINEKNKHNQQLWQKLEQLNFQISMLNFPENYTPEQTTEEIKTLELKKNSYLTKKSSIQEKLKQLQVQINEIKQENVILIGETEKINELEKLKEQLTVELQQKEIWKEKKKQIEELLERTLELMVKNKTILEQALGVEQNLSELKFNSNQNQCLSNQNQYPSNQNQCPTCLQKVSEEHCQQILNQERIKIKQAENLLTELQQKKQEILQQKRQLTEKIDEAGRKEAQLAKISSELTQLQEKKEKLSLRQEKLKNLVQENNLLINQLMLLDNAPEIPLIDKNLSEKRELLQHWEKRKLLEQQVQENSFFLTQNKEQKEQFLGQLKQSEQQLSEREDLTEKIMGLKQKILELRKTEKELIVQQAQFQTQLNHLFKQELESQEIIIKLMAEKNKLVRFRELNHWLEEYFLNVTYTIEKQMMLNINGLFNQLFQEMFSTLIEEENVFSRIDDSFNPIIEQNGYEVAFSNLSGGEKTSVALAYRLALNKVINDVIHEIKTKELLILDEPTDGFSSEQLDKVREVLEKLNLKQTIIVSHESKIETFVEKVIRISKNEQMSQILE